MYKLSCLSHPNSGKFSWFKEKWKEIFWVKVVCVLKNTAHYFETNAITSGGSGISPRRVCQLPEGGGRQHTILPNFPKNCMKLKEFGPPGGTHPSRPPKISH